jgi:hypothetical protein
MAVKKITRKKAMRGKKTRKMQRGGLVARSPTLTTIDEKMRDLEHALGNNNSSRASKLFKQLKDKYYDFKVSSENINAVNRIRNTNATWYKPKSFIKKDLKYLSEHGYVLPEK